LTPTFSAKYFLILIEKSMIKAKETLKLSFWEINQSTQMFISILLKVLNILLSIGMFILRVVKKCIDKLPLSDKEMRLKHLYHLKKMCCIRREEL
jgi:hypothetical protein